MKDSVFGIVILGTIGSLVASVIINIAQTNQDYSWVKTLFTSTISIPSWSLFLLIMLSAVLLYLLIVLPKHNKTNTKNISTEPKKIIKNKKESKKSSDREYKEYKI